MATVHLRMGSAMGGGAPVNSPIPDAAQTMTSSGTSTPSTIAAKGGEYLRVVASGGAVYVAVGAAPTAGANLGDMVPDGGAFDCGPLKAGDKVAIKDV